MRTKLLMSLSALFMGAAGAFATFFPQELSARFGTEPESFGVLALQVTGALYLGFAMLNWMARGSTLGGIYGRPITLGNFLHFAMVTLALLGNVSWQEAPLLVAVTALYAAFAVWFAMVLFTNPRPG